MSAAVAVPSVPIRSCIGCRRRVAAAELFRVVVTPGSAGTASARDSSQQLEAGPVVTTVVPDPRRRLPGRGAWLHSDPDCVALATRRHAFGRALRVSGPVDADAVGEYVTGIVRADIMVGISPSGITVPDTIRSDTTSGSTAGDDEQ